MIFPTILKHILFGYCYSKNLRYKVTFIASFLIARRFPQAIDGLQ